MCDVVHSILVERVERLALGDRQAELTAVLQRGGADGYEPPSVEAAIERWEAWLAHDPADTEEARDERLIRELMGVA